MKKHGIYIALLCCVFLCACGSVEEQRFPDVGKAEEIIPPSITKGIPGFLTPTVEIQPETTGALSGKDEKITTAATITPTEQEENIAGVANATPIVSEERITSTVTVTPVVTVESPTALPGPTVTPQIFVLDELGLESHEDAWGRQVYEASASFYDEKGLLCVGLKATRETEGVLHEIEKCYYLPNGTVYREKNMVSESELRDLFEGNITEETYVTKAYEPIVFETTCNRVWTTEGQMEAASELFGELYKSKYSCTTKEGYIPVKEGEKYRVTFYFAAAPKVAGILFMSEKDQVIESLSFNATTQLKDQMISVPKGAVKMHLSLFSNQTYRIERRVELVGMDLSAIAEEFYAEQSLKAMLAVPKKSKEQYALDKAYITFVLDDCRPDMDKIADVFEEYNVPLCIAAVHENLPFPASEGEETRREVCERVVVQGGEVLSHDAEVITAEVIDNYSELMEQFFEDKWILHQMGFDVNGIVLAGGSGQLVGHPVTDLFARTFYQYSDLYGEQEFGEPYYHRRYWLGNGSDTYEDVINKAVAEKKWVVLYLHDLKEVNEKKLHEILQYVTSLEEEDAEIVTYKTLYDQMW